MTGMLQQGRRRSEGTCDVDSGNLCPGDWVVHEQARVHAHTDTTGRRTSAYNLARLGGVC